jgi:L-alanine-DL-glutamate epimerase-like enolase superfamily enzyme
MARTGPPIVALNATAYTVPTGAPEADGTAAWDSTTAVVVHAQADAVTGLGWSYASPAAADIVNDVLAPTVIGTSAWRIAEAADSMSRATRNAGRAGVIACAISAVDIALWDLKARLLEIALADLLPRAHERVAVYGSGGFTTYDDEELTTQLRGWVEQQHIPRVKIKIGESTGSRETRDLERIERARAIVGPETELYVDANGGYTLGQARRVERTMRQWDVRWFEEPVSSDYPHSLAAVRAASLADVAAGEYIFRLTDACTLLEAGAVDCLQIDVTRCGGITQWLRIAALAASHGLDVSGHCAPQLSAHVGCATANIRHLELFHDHQRLEPMLFEGTLPIEDGAMRPDASRVGHGMSLRPEAEAFTAMSVGGDG